MTFGTGVSKPKVGAVAGQASVVGETLSMVPEADLVIGLVEAAEAGDQFSFAGCARNRSG